MSVRTEIRVTDTISSAIRGRQIVQVQILRGDPHIGMELTSSTASGRWRITGFGTAPSESVLAEQSLLNLSVLNLEQGSELAAGMLLVEPRGEQNGDRHACSDSTAEHSIPNK